jgi:nicotinic acid mononucleotide adenylyltransferase
MNIKDATTIKKIKALHKSNKLFYITATGGGTSFVGEFLKISGGSACIVGGRVTYATEDTDSFIKTKLPKYSNGDAACKLAVASYEHCVSIKPENSINCVGVGAACSLFKENERKDRIHTVNIAIHTKTYTFLLELEFNKNSREIEEELCNSFILDALNHLFVENKTLEDTRESLIKTDFGDFAYNSRLTFSVKYAEYPNQDVMFNSVIKNAPLCIYPGSFRPRHQAHIDLKQIAEEILKQTVYYELTTHNSYKPAMDFIDLNNRTSQFTGPNDKLLVTTAPRFVDKVKFLRTNFNCTDIVFVVGADTWERVYDAAAHKNGDVKFFEDNNVKFLVFGRNTEIKNQDSVLLIKNDRALNYDNPISSTAIRKNETNP